MRLHWLILPGFLVLQSVFSQGPLDETTPLILTPYLEAGKIEEAKHLALVPFTEDLGLKSYAGFFTVDKNYNSNQFFWYFPPATGNSAAPIILWLQGGPGGSSLFGLFGEHGPIQVVNGQISRREINWAIDYHLIYIDNPVGTGFSFTNDTKGYCTEQTEVGEHLYSSMMQFFQMFPELQNNKFIISGESYGGKYVPALAYTIHNKNKVAVKKINLAALAIGNGWSDPENQFLFSQILYEIGLVDRKQARVIEQYEKTAVNLIRDEKFVEAFEVFNDLMYKKDSIVMKMVSPFGEDISSNYVNPYPINEILFAFADVLKSNNSVRRDIHVGELPYEVMSQRVFTLLKGDIMKPITPWISQLLDHYYVLVYTGQLDIGCSYVAAANYLDHLNFTGADEFKSNNRSVWKVESDVAGYMRRGGKLIELMIRNAGHMSPIDQPKWLIRMIDMLVSVINGL